MKDTLMNVLLKNIRRNIELVISCENDGLTDMGSALLLAQISGLAMTSANYILASTSAQQTTGDK